MELSQLKIYSLGIVAANKKLSSKDIEVTPIENSPMASGEITDNVSTYSAKATDDAGSAYQVEVKTTNTISATWLPIGSSNRLTAPDVRRGETVVLYQFADSDKYWWATLKDDMRLRKLETVIYGFSATTDEDAEPNAENMYFLEISTHQQLVHFHTSKANGEPFAYDVQINTKEGCITIQDDDGQVFVLDSPQRRLFMKNRDNSHVDIDKRSIKLFAADLIDMKTKKCVQNFEELETNSPVIKIKGQTTHTGNMAVIGNFQTKKGADGSGGQSTVEGDFNTLGSMEISENLTVGETVSAKKVVSAQPIQAPNVK